MKYIESQKQSYFLYYLTSVIVLGMFFTFTLIRVPVPNQERYILTPIEGPFRIFNLKEHLAKYDSLKVEIKTQQFRFTEYYHQATPEQKAEIMRQIQGYIFNTVKDHLIPFWYETEWDFNGTTERPREGAIACGYFVTTVLRHAGFRLDKYHLSRKASRELIENVCLYQNIKTIRDNDFDGLMSHLGNQNDGIYIIGLDTHVGFLIKENGEMHFVHSRKPRRVGVVREKATEASALLDSEIYVIGNLLENEDILFNWLTKV